MNKKLLVFSIIGILGIMLVSAAVLYYSVSQNVQVNPSFTFTGTNTADAEVSGGESVVSDDLRIDSDTSALIPLSIKTTYNPNDAGISSTEEYILSASGVAGTESRVYVNAEDVGISTLADLNTISWDANVMGGYLPHVDVLIDTDGDGVKDDALVFEYAKVSAPYDNAPYPTGELDTFGDKGTISDTSRAWLSSGAAGDISNPAFIDGLLSQWKAGTADDNSITGTTEVIGFDFEIDNWIADSDSDIKNILINGNPVEISLKPNDYLNFRVYTDFDLSVFGDYTVTTEVSVR